MRYIGNKIQMLENIQSVINENITDAESFFDIFSGSATVARYFKNQYKIMSNDNLYFSYVLQRATVENDKLPNFKKLEQHLGMDLDSYLNDIDKYYDGRFSLDKFFIMNNYSPIGDRMYFTIENSKIIDLWRLYIEQWLHEKIIDLNEYYYLIARVIETVPFFSNISGTYGAFLKTWDPRAIKKIKLVELEITTNHKKNKSYNFDSNEVLNKVSGDILYIDPPYNERQYLPNYHLLETIARYDYPKIKGVTGIREYNEQKSNFCLKNKVYDEFESLIRKAKFKHILLSYSTDGIMEESKIVDIMSKYSVDGKCKVYKFPHKRYKSRTLVNNSDLYELVFYIKKIKRKEKNIKKSPLNYTGGKTKILDQLLPLFPIKINTFIDLFCGGLNVSLNVKAEKYVAIDINSKLIEMMHYFRNSSTDDIVKKIEALIHEYQLTKYNQKEYNLLRDEYNTNPTPLKLFTLTCFSFNHLIRFNNSFNYNAPFGKNRSSYNENIRKNLIAFIQDLKDKNIEFIAKDFEEIDFSIYSNDTFIYADPPYFISSASYNDGKRGFGDWTENKESALLNLLDEFDKRGIKIALSNVFEHNGLINSKLIKWSKKYNVNFIDHNYNNSNYQSKAKNYKTTEVLITNYEVLK
jgi:adenine-specific DNA-methyltransferase